MITRDLLAVLAARLFALPTRFGWDAAGRLVSRRLTVNVNPDKRWM
jgi:hypothetical protein